MVVSWERSKVKNTKGKPLQKAASWQGCDIVLKLWCQLPDTSRMQDTQQMVYSGFADGTGACPCWRIQGIQGNWCQ